ncbi:phage minor tail protein L [Stenotrophomonas lactitubi]|uniref:phage minor tail protein L n=1 Tax=Stenotrophomonas lactitubi TaxID=2045214 RepID=UPI003209CB25
MITADAQQLEPGGRVTLYELDASNFGADQLFFHQHLQSGVIWWQGQEYGPWPIEATGFARTSDQPPNPRLKVSNIDGRITALCLMFDDLVGARVIRRQTLVKYLDGANFPPLKNRLPNSSFEVRTSDAATPTGWTHGSSVPGGTRGYVNSNLPSSVKAVRLSGATAVANQYMELRTLDSTVPVEPGQPFTASGYMRCNAGVPTIITWFLDANGATVGGALPSTFPAAADFQRNVAATRVAPANAAYARVYYRLQTVARRNRLNNGSLDLRTSDTAAPTGWVQFATVPGASRSYVDSNLPNSSKAFRMVGTATAVSQYMELRTPDSLVQVQAGQPFVASASMRGVGGSASIIIWFLDAAGATVGGALASTFAVTSEFQRNVSAARTAPAGAAFARVYFRTQSTVANQSLQIDIDNVQFEQGASATEFQPTGTDGPIYEIDIDNVQFEKGDVATEYQFTNMDMVGSRNPTADPNEHFLDEIWFIERKVAEDKQTVEFELTTAIDLNGEQLPGRQVIAGVCGWLIRGGYRGPYCGYNGPAVADANDVPTTDPSRDQCGGRVGSCKMRFGADKPLPYGGFPAAGLLRT